MDREIKRHILVAFCCFSFFILLSIIGSYLEKTGAINREDINMPIYLGLVFIIFFILCFSIVRPLLRVFVKLQRRTGNGDLAVIQFISKHEKRITWGVWAFFTIGLMIAFPTILRDVLLWNSN